MLPQLYASVGVLFSIPSPVMQELHITPG